MPMHLRVQRGPNAGAVFPLRQGANTIGRSAENAIVLPDDKVSSVHARVDVRPDGCTISDLDSTNGTLLDDVPLSQPAPLRPGAAVLMGNTALVFDVGEMVAERPTTSIRIVLEDDTRPQFPIAWSPEETTQLLPPTGRGIEAGELRRLYGVLTALYRVTSVINRSTTLDDLLANVLDVVFDIVPADRGSIVFVEDDGRVLQPRVGRCRKAPYQTIRVSQTIVRDVVRTGRGVLTRDATEDERFRRGDSIQRFGIRSAICVPIRTPRELFGAIYLDTRSVDRQLSERDLELLTAIGTDAGLAVENLRLRQENLEAERLAAIGEAVAGLSHYIRNVLQSMEAARYLVPAAIEDGDMASLAEAWGELERNIGLIGELALNMLSYSKKAGPDYVTFDPNTAVRHVVEMVVHRAQEHGAELKLHLDGAVPPVRLDRGAVQRVLLNLINNAIDAAPDGHIQVSTHWDAAGRHVEIHITDDGPGIPAPLHETIFHAFFTTKGSEGTGLGLAVSKKLIEELGGRIGLESAPAQGTTFTIALPAEPPPR